MFITHWCVFLSLIVFASSTRTTSGQETAWQNFKENHGKQYRNLREETVRKQIFVENFNKIATHNKLFEQGLVSYSLKINQFADLTNAEIGDTVKGYRKTKFDLTELNVIEFVPDEDAEVPNAVDWREKGAVTPIKNQGYCGSCWAFSATGALEGQYFMKTGKLVAISEQNLVDCSSEHNNEGCNGGDMSAAFAYIHNQDGIDSEDSYPYEAIDGECRYTVAGNVTSGRGYATIENGNEEYLKAAVATIGPISVAIDASQSDFSFYARGVYYNPDCSKGAIDPENELDHGVLVVGYGTSEDGEDYWTVKNSWGSYWGEEGYIRMARNRDNNCGIAAEASFPLNY